MHKILVVDDEVTITTHLEERLTWMGYEVVGRASSGEESINMARRHNPDLILMDIVMPGELDGIDASKIIKKELDIPIVFLTAYPDDKFVKRAKHVEPFGYLIKPINPDEIRATIEVALHKKNVERGLYELLEVYCTLVDSINYAIITVDSHKNIAFWNHGAEDIFGYTADEALSMPMTFIMPERFREGYENEKNRMILTGKSDNIGKTVELYGLKKDGSEFPFEFSMAFWKKKEVGFFTCIGCDITERKQAEEERKRVYAQIIQSEKMAGIETLARGITHEFNNLLQIMSGHVEFALKTKKSEDIEEAFDIVLRTSDIAAKIVKDLSALSKKEISKKELCDITEAIESALSLIEMQLKKQNIIIARKYEKTPKIWIEKAGMQQVFLNMFTNAREAMLPKGGTLEIGVRQVGKNVEVCFRDTGIGIEKEDLGRVFEPFYTTKGTIGGGQDSTPGIGLGLSVSYGIVKRQGGTIEVESEKGKGAAFTVKLPFKEVGSKKGSAKEGE